MHALRHLRPLGFLAVLAATIIAVTVTLPGMAVSFTGHWSAWYQMILWGLLALLAAAGAGYAYWERSWPSWKWTLFGPLAGVALAMALIAASGFDFGVACHAWRTADACLR